MKLLNQAKFTLTIDHLRQTILLPAEFAARVHNLAENCQLPSLPREDGRFPLELTALSLGRKELESILVALVQGPEPELKRKLLRILAVRSSPSLSRLIWALFQYFYLQPALREAAALAAADPSCAEELLGKLFQGNRDVVQSAVEILQEDGGDVSLFMSKYNLIGKSPFAIMLVRQFFQQTDERGFLVNEEYFFEIISVGSAEEFRPCLINYLVQPWQFYSSRKINRAILNRFGLPEDGLSLVWQEIESELIEKYKQWIFIDIMEEYYGLKSKKNAVFGKFYKDIKHISFYNDKKIMVIDFGQFGIADLYNMPEHSYLMEKAVLEKETAYLTLEGEPHWLNERLAVEARDVIIEEMSSHILILNIAEIGKLFVQELLTELLRKEEGLWPVRFRHAIARFVERTD
jgi:hypothetical protein